MYGKEESVKKDHAQTLHGHEVKFLTVKMQFKGHNLMT